MYNNLFTNPLLLTIYMYQTVHVPHQYMLIPTDPSCTCMENFHAIGFIIDSEKEILAMLLIAGGLNFGKISIQVVASVRLIIGIV